MVAEARQKEESISGIDSEISAEDHALISAACQTLEHPSLAARLSSVVGAPLEIGFKLLPKTWYTTLHNVAERAIGQALEVAVSTVRRGPQEPKQDRFHNLAGGFAGAVGGFFGFPGLLMELPISTCIMLRSIADIARHEGEDLSTLEARMACMEVFALGGRTELDDAAETGYYGVRFALALSTSGGIRHLSDLGLEFGGAPAMAGFIRAVAARFGVPVSQRAAAQLVPIVGAAGGALTNVIFLQHFQQMAHSHFTIRRLERKYGSEVIRVEYDRIASLEGEKE